MDRLVSVQDYEDFARTYAGIGKASASMIQGTVHVTIAGLIRSRWMRTTRSSAT
ncbi:MAG: hypothetical protein U0996_25490 [Planctomycetaceae bacterium]